MAIKTKNHEFEQVIIKGLMTDKNLCRKLLESNFSEEIFDVPIHRFMFLNAKARYQKSHDLIGKDELLHVISEENGIESRERDLKKSMVTELCDRLGSMPYEPQKHNFCWEELTKLFLKRKFIDIVDNGLEELGRNANLEPTALYSRIEREFYAAKKGTNAVLVDKEDIFSPEAINKRIQKYEHDKQKGTSHGLPYFLPRLTEVTGGIKSTDLILFIARQKVGKSITLLNEAVFLTSLGYNVVYVSIEQSKEEITLRADSLSTDLKHVDLKLRQLDEHNQTLYKAKLHDLSKKNGKFFVIDIPRGATISLIEKEVKDLIDQGNTINAIIIDYLGLLNGGSEDADKFYFNVGLITKQLKELCREIKIPIITAQQMNRSSEKEKTKTSSAIAYSDQIASHVDYCFCLVRGTENNLQIQTVLARDSDAVNIDCLTDYSRMLIFEKKLELAREEEARDLFGVED